MSEGVFDPFVISDFILLIKLLELLTDGIETNLNITELSSDTISISNGLTFMYYSNIIYL